MRTEVVRQMAGTAVVWCSRLGPKHLQAPSDDHRLPAQSVRGYMLLIAECVWWDRGRDSEAPATAAG